MQRSMKKILDDWWPNNIRGQIWPKYFDIPFKLSKTHEKKLKEEINSIGNQIRVCWVKGNYVTTRRQRWYDGLEINDVLLLLEYVLSRCERLISKTYFSVVHSMFIYYSSFNEVGGFRFERLLLDTCCSDVENAKI